MNDLNSERAAHYVGSMKVARPLSIVDSSGDA